jgi:hypothetical protein
VPKTRRRSKATPARPRNVEYQFRSLVTVSLRDWTVKAGFALIRVPKAPNSRLFRPLHWMSDSAPTTTEPMI